jgi:hypothetical protein
LKAEAAATNSKHYGFWNMFFHDYIIYEHCLAYEIANFSKLLKLDEPIYAYDFQDLLNDLVDTSYLEEVLLRNLDCNREPLTDFLENFKVKYKQNKPQT